MITEMLAPVAPGAPLLAAMAVLSPRSTSLAANRLALGGAAAAVAASLALLVTVPDGGAVALGGLMLVDRARALIALLAATIAVLVIGYASRALAGDGQQVRFVRLASLLTAATMTIALAGNLVVLVVAWIAVGQVLIALLGHYRTPAARQAVDRTRRTFLVADGALLVALIVVLVSIGPVAFDTGLDSAAAELAAIALPGMGGLRLLDLVAVLIVVAAIGRSALIPLHRWLPSTLAAPVPVSALLHAGVVNGAGVLLLVVAPIFGAAPLATAMAFTAGSATALVAMAVMLVRTDVKGGLVWSTAAQMGFMVVQVAIGAYGAALFHLMGHGLYKAAAFLGAGEAIGTHARARHRPVAAAAPSATVRRLAAVILASGGLGLAWWVVAPGFSAAKTLLFVTVAWLLTAYLVAGWLKVAPVGAAGSLGVAAIGAPVVAAGYLGALVGFEQLVGSALPPAGEAAVGILPLALVLGAAVTAGSLIAVVPAASGLRVRLHATLTGYGMRPKPDRDGARGRATAGRRSVQAAAPSHSHAASILAPEATR